MVVSAGSAASPSVVAQSRSASARTKDRAAPGQPLTTSFQLTAAISAFMICLADMSDNRHEILRSTQITDPGRRRCLPSHPADPGYRHEGLLRTQQYALRDERAITQ